MIRHRLIPASPGSRALRHPLKAIRTRRRAGAQPPVQLARQLEQQVEQPRPAARRRLVQVKSIPLLPMNSTRIKDRRHSRRRAVLSGSRQAMPRPRRHRRARDQRRLRHCPKAGSPTSIPARASTITSIFPLSRRNGSSRKARPR